jgi:hypothetical protein
MKMRNRYQERRTNNSYLRMKWPRKVKFPIWLSKRIGTRKAKRRVTTVVARLAGVDLGVSRDLLARVDVVHLREARTNES